MFSHSTKMLCFLVFILFELCWSEGEGPINNQRKHIFRESAASLQIVNDSATFSTVKTTVFRKSGQAELFNSADSRETSTQKYDSMKNMNLIQGKKVKLTPTNNPDSVVSTYRVNNDEDGTTCILMTVDALISFYYVTKLNENEESDTFVPNSDKIQTSGDCSGGDKSSMLLKWESFELNFDFAKTPGGEKWFVSKVHLYFNTRESTFKHINHDNVNVRAETSADDLLYPTPVGRSFKCHRELVINLYDPLCTDIKVKVLLRELTLEPFIFKNNEFGPEYLCPPPGAGSFRSETAPFMFGSLLTIASLFTVGGYAFYRYVKVNKVQYGTME